METMFPIYVFSAVLGSVLLLFSLGLSGDADADLDADADFDAGDAGADGADADGGDAAHGDVAGFFSSFLSLRFWTFFATFFGLSGLLLDGFDVLEGTLAPALVAGAFGVAAGQTVVRLLRHLSRPAGGEVPEASAYVGKTGRVIVAIPEGGPGKVRIELAGRTVDVLARTTDGSALAKDTTAILVEMRGEIAIVERFEGTD